MKANKQAENIIDGLNSIAELTTEVKSMMVNDYRKQYYKGIFLANPDRHVIESITQHGGIIADENVEEGILFCVPSEWVLDLDKKLSKYVFEGLEHVWARLIIPERKPILIYTRNSDKVRIDLDLRIGYTHVSQSNIELPVDLI